MYIIYTGTLYVRASDVRLLAKTSQPRALKNFVRSSHELKCCIFVSWGFWEPEISRPLEAVTQAKPPQLLDEHIWIWSAILEWTFADVSLMRYHPHFLHQFFSAGGDESEESVRMANGLKRCWLKFEWHLFGLWAPSVHAESTLGHWTLLALRRAEPPEIYYFETLSDQHPVCKERAERILKVLELPGEVVRTNNFRQRNDECAACVMHYSEDVVRYASGEGWGSVLGFSKRREHEIRTLMSACVKTLETARLKWVSKFIEEEAKIQMLHKALIKKAGTSETLEQKLAQYKLTMGAAAVAEHCMGDELSDIECPEGFGVDQGKGKGKAKSAFKKKLNKKTKPAAEVKLPLELEPTVAEVAPPAPESDPPAPEVDPPAPEPAPESDPPAPEVALEVVLPAGPEVVLPAEPVPPIDEVAPVALQPVQELMSKTEKGFNVWLKSLSVNQLQSKIELIYLSEDVRPEIQNYLEFVRSGETLGMCTKCRWAGCEKCSHEHALRYVLRWHKPASWWKRDAGTILRMSPLRRRLLYIYIYMYVCV